jgi:hypothetical protein
MGKGETDMSKRVPSDAEAQLLMEKLSRRTSAISVLTRGPLRAQWHVGLLQMLLWGSVGIGMYWGEAGGYLLPPIIMALLFIMEAYNANLNKRIDALVELLQQEGMLHPELRPDATKEPRAAPAG